jgi:hypothetical protein
MMNDEKVQLTFSNDARFCVYVFDKGSNPAGPEVNSFEFQVSSFKFQVSSVKTLGSAADDLRNQGGGVSLGHIFPGVALCIG